MMHDWGAAKRLDKVGKVGNRIWPATVFRCLRRIFQRTGLERNFLDLLGQLYRGECWLRDGAGAACLDHFLNVIALVVIGCAW